MNFMRLSHSCRGKGHLRCPLAAGAFHIREVQTSGLGLRAVLDRTTLGCLLVCLSVHAPRPDPATDYSHASTLLE